MSTQEPQHGFLHGLRVLELADERGEYCGSLLAGAGAEVVKIEPPGGSPTRRIGPFVDDVEDPERSLYFWRYCLGKKSVTLDLETEAGRDDFRQLAAAADVVLETHRPGTLDQLGLGYRDLSALNPGLVMASITPFGQSGPYRDWTGSDLVHLAMGGVLMTTGYDPNADGRYDTSPIAPQMWHSSHIVGAQTASAIVAALLYRERTGRGQHLDASIHRAVNFNTGSDIPLWIFNGIPVRRQTARYASPIPTPEALARTKDGRHVLAFVSAEFMIGREHRQWIEMLDAHGAADDLTDPKYAEQSYATSPEAVRHIHDVASEWVGQHDYDDRVWEEAQARRLHWAPVRRPEDNLDDAHWRERETFSEVHHEQLGRSILYPSTPWLAETCPWSAGTRAPLIGEHDADVREASRESDASPRTSPPASAPSEPFALDGVRILDLSWVVAGAGATRHLAGLGAEVLRLEWHGRHDALRSMGGIPTGEGREQRLRGEMAYGGRDSVNQGSVFADINPGKRSFSLNLKSERGVELFHELVRVSDVVFENYTANRLESFGPTYESMRRVNPSIIYVQQPGFGKRGRYADNLSSAPVAEAFSGLTEMAGLPSPNPPSGWGYYYLDWSASYYGALAVLSALYHRERTGEGQYIDGSLGEPGLMMTGTAMLDYQVNGRPWERIGNTSPYKPAAPHGVFPCRGDDRWIAIAVFDDEQWNKLIDVIGNPTWARSPDLATLAGRIERADDLERRLGVETATFDPFELMNRLQERGVPAGVCQTAAERVDDDPQLLHDEFVTPLPHSEVGEWPIRQFPIHLSESPARTGGRTGRGFPNYAEANDFVYGTILGLSDAEREDLAARDVI